MSDVIQFTKKICGVFEKAGYFVQKVLQMESTYPEMCSVNVPLQTKIGLYGGLISRLLATFGICSVFISVLIK